MVLSFLAGIRYVHDFLKCHSIYSLYQEFHLIRRVQKFTAHLYIPSTSGHAPTSISIISITLIYQFYNYLHVAKSLSPRDSRKLVTCPLTAPALAPQALFHLLLQSSPLCRHSGNDCLKLFLCDIIICNLSLFYFKLVFLELIGYTLSHTYVHNQALEHLRF